MTPNGEGMSNSERNITRLRANAAAAALACGVSVALLLAEAPTARARQGSDVIRLGVERTSVERVRVRLAPLELVATAPGARRGAEQMAGRLARDLVYSGLIDVLDPLPTGVASPYAGGRNPRAEGAGNSPAYGIALRLEGDQPGRMVWTARLLEPDGALKMGKRYTVDLGDFARTVHHLADEVVLQLTGEQGIAQTRVIFSRGSGDKRELYVIDFDGENLRQVTRNASLNLFARWSPDGRSIAYTSYHQGRQRLLMLDTASGHSARVADFQGLNLGATWAPGGAELAATLSRDGNSEVYRLRTDGTIVQRLTFDPSIECSPSWDPSGQQLAYTSDRTGSPQIYVMDKVGANRRRITFEGNYNDSAAWSPLGDRIAYVSRAEGTFQVFTVAPDGSELHQVTFAHDRDNEDPSWAPDGRHLVVSSNRTGYTNLWVIDVGSGESRALTRGRSEDTGPCWSGPPAAPAKTVGTN